MQITIIGKIVKMSVNETVAQLDINDCTGTASVQKWVDETDEDAVRRCVAASANSTRKDLQAQLWAEDHAAPAPYN